MTIALFSFFAAVTIGFGLVVAFAREIFRAAFALLGTLGGVAGMLALLGASTVAALQILIYVGGVFVLFLFAILVTDKPKATIFRRSLPATLFAGVLATLVGALLITVVVGSRNTAFGALQAPVSIKARDIGISLIGDNMLTFEAVSVLLLAGMAAAVVVIRKEMEPDDPVHPDAVDPLVASLSSHSSLDKLGMSGDGVSKE